MNTTDPRTLLYSRENILHAKSCLEKFKESNIKTGSDEDMWNYRKIVESSIHPVSGEIIPHPFRVSAIAPVNIPIVWGMIACPPSNTAMTLFLHFINQSYNTACNYSNRAGNEMSDMEIDKAYGIRMRKSDSKGTSIFEIIPIVATAAAKY
jgi:hypothetical protein